MRYVIVLLLLGGAAIIFTEVMDYEPPESQPRMSAEEMAELSQECYDLNLRAVYLNTTYGEIACRPPLDFQ